MSSLIPSPGSMAPPCHGPTSPPPSYHHQGRDTTLTKIPAPLCYNRKIPSVNYPTQRGKGPLDSQDVVSVMVTIHQPAAWIYHLTIQEQPRIRPPLQAWVNPNRLHTGVGRFNADMWRWGLSKSPASDCRADHAADSKSHHHGVPPIPYIKWSPWLDWCWCRYSNWWVATKQVPGDPTVFFFFFFFWL